jgi:hypothetical protein
LVHGIIYSLVHGWLTSFFSTTRRTEPAMITGGRFWKTRKMEATNTWSNRIEPWLVADLVRTVENKLQEEGQALFARCMYGEVGDALKKLASVCGGADGDSRTGTLNADFAKVSGCSTYPGVSSGCGIATDTNVQTTNESSASTTSTTVAEVPVQPPAVDVTALECGAANDTKSSDGASYEPTYLSINQTNFLSNSEPINPINQTNFLSNSEPINPINQATAPRPPRSRAAGTSSPPATSPPSTTRRAGPWSVQFSLFRLTACHFSHVSSG